MLRSKTAVWLAAILIAGLACAQSGLSGPGSTAPLDANSLATAVAGTASAAAAETAQINLLKNFQATLTARAMVASGTMVLTPQVSTEGTSLVKQGDGSYLFTDQEAGYSIMVPSVWLAMRTNEQDISSARILLANADPQIQKTLSTLQTSDPKVYRLIAIDTSSSDLETGYVSYLLVYWTKNDPLTIEQNIDEAKKSFSKSSPPIKVTYADMGSTSTHLPMGVMETSSKIPTTSKQTASLYQKIIILKSKNGTLVFNLNTVAQLKDKFVPAFDLMTDQIKILP